MKSQIFKNAWRMVKETGINLSTALKISWAEFKISVLELKYNTISVFDWKIQLEVRKSINVLVELKNRIKPCSVFTNKINNSGAEKWYGIGAYSGD